MKKGILFLGLSTLLFVTAYAQSLSLSWTGGALTNGQTITVVGDTSGTVYSYVDCTNNGVDSISVKVKKIEISLVAGSENTFCWVNCYLPTTYISDYEIKIGPGAVCNEFSGEYKAKGNIGISSVMYVFYNRSNPNDSVSVIINYDCSLGSAIPEVSQSSVEFSNAYPNPAGNVTSFSFSLPDVAVKEHRLIIRDMVGNIVYDEKLIDKTGTIKVNTAVLRDGVYFYSLMLEGQAYLTRKLIIKH
jgi:hypothetical protein